MFNAVILICCLMDKVVSQHGAPPSENAADNRTKFASCIFVLFFVL